MTEPLLNLITMRKFPALDSFNKDAKFIFVPMFSLTESTDYSTRACITPINLDRERPAQLTSEVLITFPTDRIALEGTEVLELRLEPTTLTQTDVNTAGNIFFQDTSIRINDTTGN